MHPIDEKAVSMSRIRLSLFPRGCGVIGLAAVLTLPLQDVRIPSEPISWIGSVLRVLNWRATSLTANPALKPFSSRKRRRRMKLKPQRPRSCLGWFAWIFGILLLIFVSGNIYAQWRMAQVTQDLASLARELGYTPDAHLHHEITVRDVSIIMGSAYCVAKLYYTTPMDLAEFTERLNQLKPETKEIRLQNMIFELSGLIPGLKVYAADFLPPTPASQREPPMMYRWIVHDRNHKTNVMFYDTTNLNVQVHYGGRRIEGNIAQVYANGGVFPIWMNCPATSSDTPAPPFD
jgi:hypothetical protein